MIDEIKGPGMEGRGGPRSGGRSGTARDARESAAPPADTLQLRNRLTRVTSELERLQEKLSRGGSGDAEASFSRAQVALQNILAVGSEEPALPPNAPPLQGVSLDRRTILELLGP